MRHIDTSAVIDLWEHYPIAQFPAVWGWFEDEFKFAALAIAKVALDEVRDRDPDCRTQLDQYAVVGLPIGDPELQEALAIKASLGIMNDRYTTGVGENDILIIALAKTNQVELVTNEALQPRLPSNMTRYKMPAVCDMPGVQVRSMRLIELIRQSGRVF